MAQRPISSISVLLFFSFLLLFAATSLFAKVNGKERGVTYDGRSLIINGNRELLFSGSIHYPRAPPEVRKIIIFRKCYK